MPALSSPEFAALLTSTLRLNAPPVALRYVTEAPKGQPAFDDTVPAGCALWRHAENRTFFAAPAAHAGCPVGMHTQGLPMSEATSAELMGLIGHMGSLSYLDGGEVPSIPTVPAERTGATGGLVEGPLADVAAGETIDAVLVWVTPAQAMLLNEATGGATWGGAGMAVHGRPACAAIPAALSSGRATLSLGCAGMRTFTEIADERTLMVLPGATLERVAEGLRVISAANEQMCEFYAGRKVTLN